MRLTLGLVVTALIAAGCSDSAGAPPLEEALGILAAPKGSLPLIFVDTAGIRETLDYEPVPTDEMFVDPESMTPRDRWAKVVPGTALQSFSPAATDSPFPSTDVEWVALGSMAVVVKAPEETLEAVRGADTERELRFAEDLVIIDTVGEGLDGPDLEQSQADEADMQALAECAEGAHVVSLVPAKSFRSEHAFATASRVDEDGVGRAWACVFAPGEAQQVADGIDREGSNHTLGEVTVDGDMVRVEMSIPDREQPMPATAAYGFSGARQGTPGF